MRATVLKTTEKRQLTTLPPTEEEPEGGWVELRRMSYGEKLRKDADAMKMRFNMNGSNQSDVSAEVAVINEAATMLEFARCIVDHNLTDEGDSKLDFRKQVDVARLDPRVGQEISELIGEMNDFENAAKSSVLDDEGK